MTEDGSVLWRLISNHGRPLHQLMPASILFSSQNAMRCSLLLPYRLVHTQIRFQSRSQYHNWAKEQEGFHMHGVGDVFGGVCLFLCVFAARSCVNFLKCSLGLCATREFDLSVCADIRDSIWLVRYAVHTFTGPWTPWTRCLCGYLMLQHSFCIISPPLAMGNVIFVPRGGFLWMFNYGSCSLTRAFYFFTLFSTTTSCTDFTHIFLAFQIIWLDAVIQNIVVDVFKFIQSLAWKSHNDLKHLISHTSD